MGLATVTVTVLPGRSVSAPKRKSRKRSVQEKTEIKWRLFRDETITKLKAIREQMQRTFDADELVILEQQEINCLYLLDGAPRDPLQAPAEEA